MPIKQSTVNEFVMKNKRAAVVRKRYNRLCGFTGARKVSLQSAFNLRTSKE